MRDRLTLPYVLDQKAIPVVLRRTGKGEQLRVRLPFAENNGKWLQNGRRTKPEWVSDGTYWQIPKAWFNDTVDRALVRFGKVYFVQPFREQEICSSSCQNATGHICQCSCMGEHHGSGNDGSWFEVSDAFSTRGAERYLACRLLTKR